MNNNSDNNTETCTDEAINAQFPDLVELTIGDILIQGEERLFIDDVSKQLMIKGTPGQQINLSDLLPAESEPGEWMKARGSVTVDGCNTRCITIRVSRRSCWCRLECRSRLLSSCA